MRYLIAVALILLAAPALADEAKPPVWLMVVEFKSGVISANYASPDKCQGAAKIAALHLKIAAKIHCFPVLAQ
jgi:hypothetical protein